MSKIIRNSFYIYIFVKQCIKCYVFIFIVHSIGSLRNTINNSASEFDAQCNACQGDQVEVEWNGYHNIQEVSEASIRPVTFGIYWFRIVTYYNSGHKQIVELPTVSGQTRYFICVAHCSSGSKFAISSTSTEAPTTTTTTTTTLAPVQMIITLKNAESWGWEAKYLSDCKTGWQQVSFTPHDHPYSPHWFSKYLCGDHGEIKIKRVRNFNTNTEHCLRTTLV